MKIVKEWLGEFVSLPKNVTDEEIALRLSLGTVEVEGIRKTETKTLDRIVVGEIVSLESHPSADRLRVAVVSAGAGAPKKVVCGGSNLSVGMKVALALPGAAVRWHGEGEPIILDKTVIRGVESEGMICASSEIGLIQRYPTRAEREIFDLSFLAVPTGTPLASALGEQTVFEIDNKSLSHRPDLWGYRGVAREVAALFASPFHDKALPNLPSGSGHHLRVSVHDPDGCSRYVAVVVDGVAATPSPEWMQDRLRASGVRPINALVDITNYVMLEYGQPMHAFDCDTLSEKNSASLIVRRAQEGESMKALDGGSYMLSPDMLVIAHERGPIAIAGVIGGEESAVSEKTTKVIFEAAHFAPGSVRRTAGALRIATESSRRFEKDLDRALPPQAMARCLQLCAALFPNSRVISPLRDIHRPIPRIKPIVVRLEDIERRLGLAIPLGRVATLLKRLGFGVSAGKKEIAVTIPSFRTKDITIPEDIMEEILRFVGYENVPSILPRIALTPAQPDTLQKTARALRNAFVVRYAFQEVRHYAFVSPAVLHACGERVEDYLVLENPLSDERPYLCRSLLPNLLESFEKNQQTEKRRALCEINRVFLKESTYPDIPSDKSPSVPHQPLFLALLYAARQQDNLFSTLADMVRSTLRAEGWPIRCAMDSSHTVPPVFSARRTAKILVRGVPVGTIGAVSARTRSTLGITDEVIACEIDLSLLVQQSRDSLRYGEPSAFPAVLRDVTFVLEERHQYDAVAQVLEGAHPFITALEPFALFRDEKKAGKNKKCLSFHITYQTHDRTLTSEEADRVHRSVIDVVRNKFDAEVR